MDTIKLKVEKRTREETSSDPEPAPKLVRQTTERTETSMSLDPGDPYYYPPVPTKVTISMPLIKQLRAGVNGGSPHPNYTPFLAASKKHIPPKFVWPRRPPSADNYSPLMAEKRWRVDIFHDTLEFCRARQWKAWQPCRLNIRYEIPKKFLLEKHVHQTEIIISAEDSVAASLRLLSEMEAPTYAASLEDIPLMLNMANQRTRGGGVLHGARAQEEDICRRTDLYVNLQQADYPLPEFGSVYSFPISILRDSKRNHYEFLPTSSCHPIYYPQVGVLSAAAYAYPDECFSEKQFQQKMRRKINALLTAAVASGHRVLVLSAWGCGAFKNPPAVVAALFAEALRNNFATAFKKVIFALDTQANDSNLSEVPLAFIQAFGTTITRPQPVPSDPVYLRVVPPTDVLLPMHIHLKLVNLAPHRNFTNWMRKRLHMTIR